VLPLDRFEWAHPKRIDCQLVQTLLSLDFPVTAPPGKVTDTSRAQVVKYQKPKLISGESRRADRR
jgi:hypothetical protein